jgi:cell division protein ZapA
MDRERLKEIRVMGQTYTVKADTDETHLNQVTGLVNEKAEDILKKTRSVSTLNVAILTALNLADELLREKGRRLALLQEIEARSKDLAAQIDLRMDVKEEGTS